MTVPIHAWCCAAAQDHGLLPDGAVASKDGGDTHASPRSRGAPARHAASIRTRAFRCLAVGFGLAQLATTAMIVHLVPLLLERGYRPAVAAGVVGAVGLMGLPGRLVFTPLGGLWPRGVVTALIFALQAVGIVALLASPTTVGLWTFVACFGLGFGAITPARAAMVADLFGAESYASISGVLAVVLAASAAIAPVGASLVRESTGDYRAVLIAMLAASCVSGWMALAADRKETALGPSLEDAA